MTKEAKEELTLKFDDGSVDELGSYYEDLDPELEIIEISSFDHAIEVLPDHNQKVDVEDGGRIYRYWVRMPTQKDMKMFMRKMPKNVRAKSGNTLISNDVDTTFLVARCVVRGEESKELLFGRDASDKWDRMPAMHVTAIFKKIADMAGLNDTEEEVEGKGLHS